MAERAGAKLEAAGRGVVRSTRLGQQRRLTGSGVAAPWKGPDKAISWLALGGLWVLACFPLLIDLGGPDLVVASEARQVSISVETWSRQAGIADGGLSFGLVVPRRDGKAVVQQPPGMTWWHLLALQNRLPDKASSQATIHQLRLVSVFFAMLMLGAVFWAGHSIGGVRTASLSALVMLASPAWIPFARLGIEVVPTLALSTLSVAGALWAISARAELALKLREGIGWFICGVALALAVLTGGWVALGATLPPILAFVAMQPERWISAALGLAGALAILSLGILAWVGHLIGGGRAIDAGWLAWGTWGTWGAWGATGGGFTPWQWITNAGWRVVWMVAIAMPWSLWLAGGLIQPFSSSTKGWRQRMLVGWLWFVAEAVGLWIALALGADSSALLFALPAAAVVVGQLFRRLIDLSSQGRHARVWQICRWPMAVFFVVLAIAVPLGFFMPNRLLGGDPTSEPMIGPTHWAWCLAIGLAMLGGAVPGLRFCISHHPGRALTCWAIWTVGVVTMLTINVSGGPLMRPMPEDGEPREQILPLSAASGSALEVEYAISDVPPQIKGGDSDKPVRSVRCVNPRLWVPGDFGPFWNKGGLANRQSCMRGGGR